MRKVLSGVMTVVLALGSMPASAAAVGLAKDPEVVKGIQAVDDGEYDTAILVLDSAARRLAAKPGDPDLPLAYLHLGIAYVGKGAEAAAKSKFREALKQIRDLSLSADKYPPKVINVFEAAREEVQREAQPAVAPRPVAAAAPKASGGNKTLWIVGGVAAVGAGVAVAAASGGGDDPGGEGGLTTDTFANQVLPFGAGRDFAVEVRGNGTLTATCDWNQDGVVLGMYIVNLANSQTVLKDADKTGVKQLRLSVAVTPGTYRLSVTNSTGGGPVVDTTFTLNVVHP